MIALLFVLFILGLLSGWSVGLLAILVSIYQFADSLGINFSFLHVIFSVVVLLSIPACLALIGLFLDDFIFPFDKNTYFTGLAWAISCYLLVSSDSFVSLIEKFFNPISLGSLFSFSLLIVNKIFLSSTIVALGLIFLVLCIELPFLYLSKIVKANFVIPWQSVRSILICFLLSFSFQVIYDFIGFEVNVDDVSSSELETVDRLGGD